MDTTLYTNIFKSAQASGINIIKAKSNKDKNRVAIHLLNPTLSELEDALYVAQRDLYPTIVIHNNQTWK